ncbi:MAG TPA: peptidoglycan-binding protein [Bacillales bacterium]|nr:peptidoglycan-binding protein [Bacillales bacterium]
MRFNKKLKTFALTSALAGIMAAAPIAAHAELGNETLHQGMWSPDVKALQNVLHDKGYFNLSATGYYGQATKDAVRAFQKDHGLDVNGQANQATFAALDVQNSNINEKPLLWEGGDTGRGVKQLQKQLKGLQFMTADPTGTYDEATKDAVKAFQESQGLKKDGMAGPKTLSALQDVVKKAKSEKIFNKPILKKGDSGDDVKELQSQLTDLGYFGGKIDGQFDTITEWAVRIFQVDNHLKPTGVVKYDTYLALNDDPISVMDAAKALAKQSAGTDEKVKAVSTHQSSNSDSSSSDVSQSSDHQNYKTVTVKSTAYTASCPGCSGITATGINLLKNPDSKVIAVDPSVIPLGSKVYVPGYGYAIAGDTGGAINGHRIDVYFQNRSQALNWGVREITVKVYE